MSEILNWIQSNYVVFVAQLMNTGTQKANKISTWQRLSFSGCEMTLHRDVYATNDPQSGRPWEVHDDNSFKLADMDPTKIRVLQAEGVQQNGAAPYMLNVGFSAGGQFQLLFTTQDMANRQAKAWHDAIVACGGKAVPDNLY